MAEGRKQNRVTARFGALVHRVQRWKPVRVFLSYSTDRGPLLASGLAYQALFAVFAGLWAAFSIAGLVVSGDGALQASILRAIREAVPGLIDDGTGAGAIDPDVLLSATVYNVMGVIALVGLLITALGWLASARASVRSFFDVTAPSGNLLLQKAIDLGLGLGFGALLVVSGALSFVSTSATGSLLDLLGVDQDSVAGTIVSRSATLVIMVALYAVALGGLYRLLAGIRIPWRFLRTSALLGAAGLGALTVLGTALLGGATSNPLIASFAVVAGLLIYFNLACQIMLLGASWIAVSVKDAGIVLDPRAAAERLAKARELVAANEPAPAPVPRSWWRRLLGRERRIGVGGPD